MGVRNGLRAALAGCLLAVALAPGSASASSACPGDDVVPTMETAKQATLELICDIDAVRAQHGLPMLRWNWKLWWMAQNMANDLAKSSTFSHTAPDGKDLYDREASVDYLNENADGLLLENLGWSRGIESSPLAVTLGWMTSTAHRENILDPAIEEFAIGIQQGAPTSGGEVGLFYVVDFGRAGTVVSEVVAQTQRRRARRARCAGRTRRAGSHRRHHSRRSRCGRRGHGSSV
jgi:uncharacterized protein YkwD